MDFNKEAKNWDTPMRVKRAQILAQAIYESLDKQNGLTGLEIGCGTGLISFELSQYFKSIYLVDTSVEMLAVLKEKINQSGTKNSGY